MGLFFLGRADRAGETSLQHQRRMHSSHCGLPAGEAVRWECRRQQVMVLL